MKLKLMPLALLTMLVVLFASCGKKSDVPVPADAGLVFHIDGASLNSKLSWDEIKQSEWFKIAHQKTDDSLAKKILEDPSASGIDIKSDLYIFMKMVGKGGYTAITGVVKDEKAFAAFVEKVMKEKKASTEGSLSVVRSEHGVLTWKKNRFVFIDDSPGMNAGTNMMGNRFDEERHVFSPDSLVKFANEVYDLKGSNSVGTNTRFAEMMKEKGDAHFWLNGEHMYKNAMPPGIFMLTKANLLFEGNVTAATMNFDNGKMTMDSKSYFNKELEALYTKYGMKNLDADMLKKIPSQNVAAVLAMNYPPEGLKAFLSLLGLDGMINSFLANEGFSIDDFIKANKGDILFAVSDFGIKPDTTGGIMTYPRQKPEANILFATSINDRPSFDKLVNLLQKKLGEMGEGASTMASRIPYALRDNWFIAGSDSATINAFGTTSYDQPFISKISGHPIGAFVDIQKFINGGKPAMDSTALLIADESLKVWQDIVFYGGEFKSKASIGHFEVNMVDKNTNSLKQLNNYISFVAKITDEAQKKRREQWNTPSMPDTLAVPPAAAPQKPN